MKVHFSQKLGTRLFIYPVLVLLAVFFLAAAVLYYFSPLYSIRGFYKQHLVHLASEKRLSVDTWFEYHKKNLENLSRSQSIRDNLVVLSSAPVGSGKSDGKAVGRISKEVQGRTSKLLEDMAFSSNCRMVALLSKEGRVLASSQKELSGEDWSERPLIREMAASSKPGTIVGFYGNGSSGGDIVLLTPVLDADDDAAAVVYSVMNVNKLAALLRIEDTLYRTERIELIDRDGNLVLTKGGIPEKSLRYNLPKDNKGNAVRLRDSLFFYVLGLNHAPFRLIAIVEEPEVMRPYTMLLVLFGSFAVLLLLLMAVQSAYLGPRLVTKPLSRLVHAAKAASSGDLAVDMGKDYTGEMLQLKSALEAIVMEMKAREASLRDDPGAGTGELKPALLDGLSSAVKGPLVRIIAGAEAIPGAVAGTGHKGVSELVSSARELRSMIEDVIDLSRADEGTLAVVPEEFNVCELVREVEEYSRNLIGPKEIELVVDCHEVFTGKSVSSDRGRLKQVIERLAGHAVLSTDAGTVTILASETMRDGIEYIELSVADTGRGFDREALERVFEDYSTLPSSPGLVLAKKVTEALGGTIEIESEEGKGSVFTVTIPLKAVIY